MKIIQITVIPSYEDVDYSGKTVFKPRVIGLSEEGQVYRLLDGNSPEQREWKLIK